MILGLFDWPQDEGLSIRSRTDKLDALDQSVEWLRQTAASLVAVAGRASKRDDFAAPIRSQLAARMADQTIAHLTLSSRVQKPSEEVWALRESMSTDLAPPVTGLPFNTIHSSKGHEHAAVLVGLPEKLPTPEGRSVLEDWSDDINTEQRRVLYVAASRAQRVLAFGSGTHTEQARELLSRFGVAVEVR